LVVALEGGPMTNKCPGPLAQVSATIQRDAAMWRNVTVWLNVIAGPLAALGTAGATAPFAGIPVFLAAMLAGCDQRRVSVELLELVIVEIDRWRAAEPLIGTLGFLLPAGAVPILTTASRAFTSFRPLVVQARDQAKAAAAAGAAGATSATTAASRTATTVSTRTAPTNWPAAAPSTPWGMYLVGGALALGLVYALAPRSRR